MKGILNTHNTFTNSLSRIAKNNKKRHLEISSFRIVNSDRVISIDTRELNRHYLKWGDVTISTSKAFISVFDKYDNHKYDCKIVHVGNIRGNVLDELSIKESQIGSDRTEIGFGFCLLMDRDGYISTDKLYISFY